MNDNLISAVSNKEASDSFFCTKKGNEVLKEHGGELTLRQRQFLFFLSKNSKANRAACQSLSTKVSIKELIEQGLIIQKNPCDSLCSKLNLEQQCQKHSDDLQAISKHEIFGLLDMFENTPSQVNTEYNTNPSTITPAIELIANMPA